MHFVSYIYFVIKFQESQYLLYLSNCPSFWLKELNILFNEYVFNEVLSNEKNII